MPIQIIWGNDNEACNKEIEKIIDINVSKNWSNLNISKFNGEDHKQVCQALDEILTPPLGDGSRIVIIKNSPILNVKNQEITDKFELNLQIMPSSTYLILQNPQKPDTRMKNTKLIKELFKTNKASELSFNLPSIWDHKSQINYIKNIGKEMKIDIDSCVAEKILDSIGIDSSRLLNELQKAKLYLDAKQNLSNSELILREKDIDEIFHDHESNIFKILDLFLEEKVAEGLLEINNLINKGEPPLKLAIGLINQLRLHTIVLLLINEKDIDKVSSLANISNPKRIFFIRKKIKKCSANFLINLMIQFLNIESSIKQGNNSINVFTENLITLTQRTPKNQINYH
tara:strand:+ start:977 stop:2005 length:1029 start_codon:yes stop_codon:yes gene_type:complete